jgi:hypothetical protein
MNFIRNLFYTYNELNLNILKVIKDIQKETYKNLLIGSYKREVYM